MDCVCASVSVCLSDIWAGQHSTEEVAAGLCLQEEGGRDEERSGQERQHVGYAHLQQSTGTLVVRMILDLVVGKKVTVTLSKSTGNVLKKNK